MRWFFTPVPIPFTEADLPPGCSMPPASNMGEKQSEAGQPAHPGWQKLGGGVYEMKHYKITKEQLERRAKEREAEKEGGHSFSPPVDPAPKP